MLAAAFEYILDSMQQAVKSGEAERRLALAEVLNWLVEDGALEASAAEQLRKERRYYRGEAHPLAIVAEQKWKRGNTPLTLDWLAEWLAKRAPPDHRTNPIHAPCPPPRECR